MRHLFRLALCAMALAIGWGAAPSSAQTFNLLLPAVQVGDTTITFDADDFAVVGDGSVVTARLLLPYVDPNFRIDALSFTADSDPFINYSIGITTLTDNPINFIFFFATPFVGGPYNTVTNEVTATVTDFGTDGASLSPATSRGDIDMANLGVDLAYDCFVGIRVGGSSTCGDSAANAILSGPTGTLGAIVDVLLSGDNDSASITGLLEITAVDVPEPAGVLLLALGLAGVGLARWLPSRLTR
jgi:hypothetical protein